MSVRTVLFNCDFDIPGIRRDLALAAGNRLRNVNTAGIALCDKYFVGEKSAGHIPGICGDDELCGIAAVKTDVTGRTFDLNLLCSCQILHGDVAGVPARGQIPAGYICQSCFAGRYAYAEIFCTGDGRDINFACMYGEIQFPGGKIRKADMAGVGFELDLSRNRSLTADVPGIGSNIDSRKREIFWNRDIARVVVDRQSSISGLRQIDCNSGRRGEE